MALKQKEAVPSWWGESTPAENEKGHLPITPSQERARRGRLRRKLPSPFKERNALPGLGRGVGGSYQKKKKKKSHNALLPFPFLEKVNVSNLGV